MPEADERTAVVLLNLGGPDSPAAIRPFLTNLFSDPAILRLPGPLRWILARVIARRRAAEATEIYALIGGKSPLYEETRAQADALAECLGNSYRTFTAMRYWHPLTDETAREVAAWNPDHVVLLPLYPQFSSTTTASSLAAWQHRWRRSGHRADVKAICCWFNEPKFVDAIARLVVRELPDPPVGPLRVLFSAHGLPASVVADGDPYQSQVESMAALIMTREGLENLDWRVSYQSRVGPREWLRPYTLDEISQAGEEEISLVVVPIAFVSEHSETLVELDIQYREAAERAGVPRYLRVPTPGTDAAFIEALAAIVRRTERQNDDICAAGVGRQCAPGFSDCPLRTGQGTE